MKSVHFLFSCAFTMKGESNTAVTISSTTSGVILSGSALCSENTNAAIYRFISSELPPISGVLRSISLYSLFTDLLYLFMSISGYICASLASACLKHSSSTAFAYIPYFNILIACPFYSCIHSLSAAESLLSISFLVASHSFG